MPSRIIAVRYRFAGFHSWPAAPEHRKYLSAQHRHIFHIEARMAVEHDDREVEFHDLLDVAQGAMPWGAPLGSTSCEGIAAIIARVIRAKWPGRWLQVSVFEDGENGAVLSWHTDEEVV